MGITECQCETCIVARRSWAMHARMRRLAWASLISLALGTAALLYAIFAMPGCGPQGYVTGPLHERPVYIDSPPYCCNGAACARAILACPDDDGGIGQ